MSKKRKPSHPGEILEEMYIKPLNLNLEKLADRLGISRNTLFKIRNGELGISTALALSLSEAFETTPQLWLNLQQNFDLYIESLSHKPVKPLIRNGALIPSERVAMVTSAR